MRGRFLLVVVSFAVAPASALLGASGCGDTVRFTEDDGEGGEGMGGRGEGAGIPVGGGPTTLPDGGKDALPDYVDPGCPDAGPPIYDFLCDPYDQQNSGCFPEEACYIYVTYPAAPCDSEIYGSFCALAGTGAQGDACFGAMDCKAGHVCVITGSGTQCVELCQLRGEDGCTAGFVCEPIDVEGFGGCL